MAADPSVSPADTIRLARELIADERQAANASKARWYLDAVCDIAAALLAVGERDKAELSGLRVEFGEWVKAIHEAFAEREVDPQSDGPGRIRRLVLERQQAEERGERDRRQIAQLTEALAFYADEDNYFETYPDETQVPVQCPALADEGARARAVLADEEAAANG